MNPSQHLSDDELELYLMETTVVGPELARVEEHLVICSACLERAEAMTGYIATMREALRLLRGADPAYQQ